MMSSRYLQMSPAFFGCKICNYFFLTFQFSVGIEQIRVRREEIIREIEIEEEEVRKQEIELKRLQSKLDGCINQLKKKKNLLVACEKSINESETAFMKVYYI